MCRAGAHLPPLGLFFWGGARTLGGRCELRDDFRTFRIDRMAAAAVQDETFEPTAGRSLADYLRVAGGDGP